MIFSSGFTDHLIWESWLLDFQILEHKLVVVYILIIFE